MSLHSCQWGSSLGPRNCPTAVDPKTLVIVVLPKSGESIGSRSPGAVFLPLAVRSESRRGQGNAP